MTTQVDYLALSGGLDLVSGAMGVKPGRMSECQNFEQVFGKIGYRRIDGYERFDGLAQPSQVGYHILRFASGSKDIPAGSLLSSATGNAMVASMQLQSGSVGAGTAEGLLLLVFLTGFFSLGQQIKIGALVVGNAAGAETPGSLSTPGHEQNKVDVREYARQRIGKPPGSGAILGVAVYRGQVFAQRNSPDGKTASLWASSAAGWTLVRSGLLPDGRLNTDVANFSGSSTTVALFGCDGVNLPWRYDGTFTAMPPIYGSQATSTSSVAVSNGSKSFVLVQTNRSWVPGDRLIAYSSTDAGQRMEGTVTAYSTGNPLVLIVSSFSGSGTFSSWVIGAASFEDKPQHVRAHRDHLFLGYPLGQLQTSNLGDPMTYSTTAALIGVGDAITGLCSLRGAVLGVFCAGKIFLLNGSSSVNWALEISSVTSGARKNSVHGMSGNALFLDDRGLTCLQATQKFGGFEPAIFSREIKPLLDRMAARVVACRMCNLKFQYRLYFDDGTVLTAAILSPAADLQPSDVAFTRQLYPHAPTCTASGLMADGSEGMFFGTADGWVMREDSGECFDGLRIDAVMRLHFNHLKRPAQKKRFRKLTLEMDSPSAVDLNFRQHFDLDDGEYRSSITQVAEALGGGGRWDVSEWNQFYWSLPMQTMAEAQIDGVGRSMGMLIWHASDRDQPFILQGMTLQYSLIGLDR